MAPEVLASRVGPEADVWAAGVMAYQLLTGRFPFDDKSNPGRRGGGGGLESLSGGCGSVRGLGSAGGRGWAGGCTWAARALPCPPSRLPPRAHTPPHPSPPHTSPALSKVWRSILTDKLSTSGKAWDGVSDDARDFVAWLLNRDPAARPTAAQALQHPWLRGGSAERSTGRPLPLGVVQRVQRYGSSSLFKRTALQCMAAELLAAGAGVGAAACELSARWAPVVTAPGDWSLQVRGAGGTWERLPHHPPSPPTSYPPRQPRSPTLTLPSPHFFQYLYDALGFGPSDDASIPRDQLVAGLQALGYRLGQGEAERLLEQLGDAPAVTKAALAASQMDWGALAARHADKWAAAARAAFDRFDADGDGIIQREEIVKALAGRLAAGEADDAVAHAMAEACKRDESVRDGLSYDAFARMLRSDGGAAECLDLYDDRLSSGHGGSAAAAALLRAGAGAAPNLPSVAEAA